MKLRRIFRKPVRKNLELDEDHLRLLKRMAVQEGMEPDEAAARLIDEALERRQADRVWKARWYALTRREREVLVLARQGRTNEQIAESLTISPSTVKIHLKRLLRKLNLQSKSQLRERLGGLEIPPES